MSSPVGASSSLPRSEPVSSGHIPGLDGLRAIAVFSVLVFHVAVRRTPMSGWEAPILTALKAGWCGVDLFFVLSGFLITGILLDTKERPDYFARFWWRRALRIFPLYYAYLVLLFILAPTLQSFALMPGIAESVSTQAWFWLYAQNIKIALEDAWIEPTGLVGHFWSLAVEEQFYLIWPLVVLYLRRSHLLALALILIPAALLTRIVLVLWFGQHLAAYVSTPARIDALACGAVLAMMLRRERQARPARAFRYVAGISGVGLIAIAVAIDGGLDHMGAATSTLGFTGVALVSVAIVGTVVARPNGLVTGLLEHPVLARLGRHSYAIYVLHNPVIFVLLIAERRLALDWTSAVVQVAVGSSVALGVSYLLSRVTWTLIERPALRLKERMPGWLVSRAARSPAPP